jgi:hypothetical protein
MKPPKRGLVVGRDRLANDLEARKPRVDSGWLYSTYQ